MGDEDTLQPNIPIPQNPNPDYIKPSLIDVSDYNKLSPEGVDISSITNSRPEKFILPELTQKVRRKTITGRIDGN